MQRSEELKAISWACALLKEKDPGFFMPRLFFGGPLASRLSMDWSQRRDLSRVTAAVTGGQA